jgi:hypothetical protein
MGEDNWLKVALGIGASLIGSALIAFIVYAVPTLNRISESQAIIMTTLTSQSHWQNSQDQINKDQVATNQQFSVDIAQLQTAVDLNAGIIKKHEAEDKANLRRFKLSQIAPNEH